ncbi:MAG TPA: ABC transporter permease subunit [Phycisphaerae bacterium]|nr:ABC transporter permease subunit [Phycisphaerae bacterium]
MRNVTALTQRELAANFLSPVAYIVAAVFLVAVGYLFMTNTLVEDAEASIRPMLNSMAWLLVFAIPLLTMRVLADEFASGTIETLMTAPVTDVEVVVGKYLGVLVFYLALLAATLIHVILLFSYGANDIGLVVYGYVGMILIGSLYVSVGVFASALTRHQLIAAILGMGVLSVFTLVVDAFATWGGGTWRIVLSYVNILHQFEDFSKGIFDTKALAFFVTGTLFFLFLAVKVMESKRWR